MIWLDTNGPGWQGPIGFGKPNLVPGAQITPLLNQSPGVFAALTIDQAGAANVIWLDTN